MTGGPAAGATYGARVARAQVVIGVVAVVVGSVGLFLARDLDLTGSTGALVGWADLELKFMSYNPLGALLTVGVGVLAILAGGLRRPLVALVGVVMSAAMALQVLLQWRADGDNLLGGTGRNLGFDLFLLCGLATTVALARVAPRLDAPRTPGPAPAGLTPEGT